MVLVAAATLSVTAALAVPPAVDSCRSLSLSLSLSLLSLRVVLCHLSLTGSISLSLSLNVSYTFFSGDCYQFFMEIYERSIKSS